MARKTLIHKHTNQTTNNGGVISPKLPAAGTLLKGEIAVNYKNGYETLSIENDAGEVIPFASWELVLAYISTLDNLIVHKSNEETISGNKTFTGTVSLGSNATAATPATTDNDTSVATTAFVKAAITANNQLSNNYSSSTLTNENLMLESGDTYEEAFGKLEKTVNDNERITAAALVDLDTKLDLLSLDDIPDGSTRKLSDYATTTLLATKQDALVSGTNIKTINNQSLLGSGDITVKENVQADWNATTGDAVILNKPDIPDEKLSSSYQTSTLENDNLLLAGGDTYETAFSKMEKAILDNEETTAAALNDLNERIPVIDQELSETSENPVQNKVITQAIIDNEYVVSTALNNINDRLENKQNTLVSGTNIKTINGVSILGSGNINVSGGSGTGGGGDENVIEIIKVNETALTPDTNKAVNITIPQIIYTTITKNGNTYTADKTYTEIKNAIDAGNEVMVLYDYHEWVPERFPFLLDDENGSLLFGNTVQSSENSYPVFVFFVINSDGSIEYSESDNIETAINAKYTKPSTGIPKSDLATAVQTSLGKADTAIQGVKVNGTALTPDSSKAVNITVPTTLDSIADGSVRKLDNYLPLSGGTMTGAITVAPGDGKGLLFSTTSNINVSGTTNTILGFYNGTYIIGHTAYPVNIRGTNTRPNYNGNQLALYSDIPSEITESTVSGWGFTKNTGTITGITMNGSSKGTSGVVDLGTVLTSFTETDPTVPAWAKAANKPSYTAAEVGALPDTTVIPAAPGTLNTTATTAQSTSSSEALSGNITLHKIAKTGTYDDLIGKPTIPAAQVQSDWNATSGMGVILNKPTIPTVNNATLTIQKNGTTVNTFTANASSNVTANIQVNELPTVSSSDNGKILQVVNGAWALVTPVTVYTGTSTPDSSLGNDGDLYLLTS